MNLKTRMRHYKSGDTHVIFKEHYMFNEAKKHSGYTWYKLYKFE